MLKFTRRAEVDGIVTSHTEVVSDKMASQQMEVDNTNSRKIVVAMDGSDNSKYAFNYESVSGTTKANVISQTVPPFDKLLQNHISYRDKPKLQRDLEGWFVQHIHRPSDYVYLVYIAELSQELQTNLLASDEESNQEFTKKMKNEREKHQKKIQELKKLLEEPNKVRGEVHIGNDKKPGNGICEAAKTLKAILIVTGTRGMGVIGRTVIGSVSDYVLHHSTVPTVVVHSK